MFVHKVTKEIVFLSTKHIKIKIFLIKLINVRCSKESDICKFQPFMFMCSWMLKEVDIFDAFNLDRLVL